MGLLDGLLGGGLLGGSGITGGLLNSNPFQNKANMMMLAGAGLLGAKDWQSGLGGAAQGLVAGKALDTAAAKEAEKTSALKAYGAENNLTPAQMQFMSAYPDVGAKVLAEKMTPKSPQYGVIGQDEFGNNLYGWIDPSTRSVQPYGGQQAQTATPMAGGGMNGAGQAPQAGQIATAPVAIPPAPQGVDPKVWRDMQTRKLFESPKIDTEVAARQRQAQQLGMAQDDPGYKSYVLTGKLPREDAQPLTATDKKAILEADEQVSTNETAIMNLQKAKGISPNANSGWGASARSSLSNNLPDWMVPDSVSSPESGLATTDLENLVTGNALGQLRAVFGGNPTEGERAIMLQLQGSASLPNEARQKIYDRAIELANKRLQFNKQRAQELRGGTYYKAGGGQGGSQSDGWQDMGGGVKIRLKAE